MKNKRIILMWLMILFLGVCGSLLLGDKLKETYALDLVSPESAEFTGIYIPSGTIAVSGDKVNVELVGNLSKWSYISLSFRSTSSDNTFLVYLKDVSNSTYFVMPYLGFNGFNGVKGEVYELEYINLISDNNSKTYATYQSDDYLFVDSDDKKYVTYNGDKKENSQHDMNLAEFKFLNNNVRLGDKVNIDLEYTSAREVEGCSIWLKHIVYGNALYYPLENFRINPYILLESTSAGSVIEGEYDIVGLTCFYKDGGIEYFNNDINSKDAIYFDFGDNLVVKEKKDDSITSNFKLYDFSLLDNEASFGDSIQTVFVTNVDEISVLLSFYNKDTNDVLPVYLKGMEKKSFVVPSTAVAGDYELQYILVKNQEHSYMLLNNNGVVELYQDSILITNNLDINLNQSLKIVNNNNDNNLTYLFNSEDYNENVKSKIMNLGNKAVITVIADNYTVISKGVFEAIMETQKTLIINYNESEWVFNGADIEVAKDIDVELLISDITSKNFSSSFVSRLPEKTKLLTFSNNGQLPGKVLIRLKSIDLDKMFAQDNLYIYYYEQDEDKLHKVAMEIQKNYGYYEFYINHNSQYILTSSLIKEDYVSDSDKLLELNSDYADSKVSDNNTIYYIIATVVGVIVCVVILVFLIHKKRK